MIDGKLKLVSVMYYKNNLLIHPINLVFQTKIVGDRKNKLPS